jgi:hypothetical protein
MVSQNRVPLFTDYYSQNLVSLFNERSSFWQSNASVVSDVHIDMNRVGGYSGISEEI